MEDSLLLVFVKNPIPGKAKTRLAASMGNAKALEIYQKLLAYTRDICLKIDVDKEIWYGNEIPEEDLWSKAHFHRFQQMGPDLGARMGQAFLDGYGKGYKKLVIIGSDNAKISTKHLEEAFEVLNEKDVVIGPALDGGYYLLGMKRNPHFLKLFQNKQWSTNTVFSDTMDDIKKLGMEVNILETLSDIDVEADLHGTFLENYLHH